MNNIEKTSKSKKIVFAVVIFCIVCLVSGGFFPIANFNPKNKVDLGITMHILIIAMFFISCIEIGELEVIIFSKKSIVFIVLVNIVLVSLGLIFRYILELGEISNVYNFTIINVIFHVCMLVLISTLAFSIKCYKIKSLSKN